jgi:hypothetical protein
MPTIQVLTEFPNGLTTLREIDIEYIVEPSDGAYIRAVRYHSGNNTQAIYLSGTVPSHYEQRGILGQASVPIYARENHISFSVEDSSGRVAIFEVENIPVRELNIVFSPDIERENIVPSVLFEGVPFVNNRLVVSTVWPRDHIDRNDFVEAFATVGGTIIGESMVFMIQVSPNDEVGLMAIGEQLINDFPHLFRSYQLEILFGNVQSGGGFFNHSASTMGSFRTNDPWWDTNDDRDWAFHTIDLPLAWAVFGTQERQNVRHDTLTECCS